MLTDKEIYQLWFANTKDLRYLRPRRWNQLKELIQSQRITSILEFGSGISTLLFENLGMKVTSYETDQEFLNFVSKLSTNSTQFIFWDNKNAWPKGKFDLALVDGILPRFHQLRVSLKHAPFIAIDDFQGRNRREFLPLLTNSKRIDDQSTTLAIFKQRDYGRSEDNS